MEVMRVDCQIAAAIGEVEAITACRSETVKTCAIRRAIIGLKETACPAATQDRVNHACHSVSTIYR